jgi:hypothetical protein
VEPADLDLLQGQAVQLKVFQGDEDVTATATFKVDGDAIDVEGSTVGAHVPGTGTVHVTVDGKEITAAATVEPIDDVRVQLPADAKWTVGSTVHVDTIGRHGDREESLTHEVVYTISDDRVASIDEKGSLTVKGAGPLVISAKVGDHVSAEVSASVTCNYPTGETGLGFGKTMPPLSWPAEWPDGTKGTLDFAQMPCAGAWGDTKSVLLVVSAGWCKPCTAYAQYLQTQKEQLESEGMQIVIMEVQDYEGRPASSKFAGEHLNKITGNDPPGIAIGDKDTNPQSSYFQNAQYIQYFPTTMVIRTRDMKVIADAYKAGTYFMPMADIAADPEADWTFGGVFVNKCKPGDEEPGEPNNTADRAITVGPGMYRGGICDPSGVDLYNVNIAGDYTVTVNFNNTTSKTNMDVWVWDGTTDSQAIIDGSVIGSANGTNEETFDWHGPALIAVKGFAGSSGPYALTITAK